ncbi:MAG: hypothetical protein MUC92_00560, partial [Fimbriimonadaceae bacterium]|nr:hypothetical protein [Fimbriimonadaceae bacterium]
MHSLGRVLLCIVLHGDFSVRRDALAQLLWPLEDRDTAANRLRVSLNRLKAVLGDCLVADRNSIRLANLSVRLDIWEIEASLREALDEVDLERQMLELTSFSPALKDRAWQEFADLDPGETFSRWNETCRTCLQRMTTIAKGASDWPAVEKVWKLMRDRGDFDVTICEAFLISRDTTGSLREGHRELLRLAQTHELSPANEPLKGLNKLAQDLRDQSQKTRLLNPTHSQLVGNALFSNLSVCATDFAELLLKTEVEYELQSKPIEYIKILETIEEQLVPESDTWIRLLLALQAVNGTLYNYEKVFEISERLLQCELTGEQASKALMVYSFSLFHVRRWDEALAAVRLGQEKAAQHGAM